MIIKDKHIESVARELYNNGPKAFFVDGSGFLKATKFEALGRSDKEELFHRAKEAIEAVFKPLHLECFDPTDIVIGVDEYGSYGVMEFHEIAKKWETIGDKDKVSVINPIGLIYLPNIE